MTVAVGSSVGFGEVRTYQFNNGSWQQTRESIKNGDTNNSMFGQQTGAISGDGSIIARVEDQISPEEKSRFTNSHGSADGWLRSGGRPYVPPSSSVSTTKYYLGHTWILLQGIAVISTIFHGCKVNPKQFIPY